MDKYSQECAHDIAKFLPKHLAKFRPQRDVFLLSQGMPRAVKVVNAVGIFRRFER